LKRKYRILSAQGVRASAATTEAGKTAPPPVRAAIFRKDFMKYRTFTISCVPNGEMQSEAMDKFILSHNICEIEKKFYQIDGSNAYWAFCVGYNEYGTTALQQTKSGSLSEKKDYSKILTEEQYKKFEKYKEIRTTLAKEAALPPYTIFNDYELSEIAKLDEPNESNMEKIQGIGKNKVTKYGKPLLERFNNLANGEKVEVKNEKSGLFD
jgi:superfamily II DNA helicase RecQ